MTPKARLTATVEPRLTTEAQARLLVEIREQQKRLGEQAARVREELLSALVEHDGQPFQAGAYTVSLISPKARQSLDARKLLEAGVTTTQLARGTVSKDVTPYPDVRLAKEHDNGEA